MPFQGKMEQRAMASQENHSQVMTSHTICFIAKWTEICKYVYHDEFWARTHHTHKRTRTRTLVRTQAHTADRGVSWPGAKAGVKRSTVHFLRARALAIQLIIQSLCPRCCNRLRREAVNNLNVALTFTQPAEQEVLDTCEWGTVVYVPSNLAWSGTVLNSSQKT